MMNKKPFWAFALTVAAILLIHADGVCGKDELDNELERVEAYMLRDGSYAKAVKDLETLIEEHPRAARIYQDMGIAFYGLMEYDKSIDFLKEAQKLDYGRTLKKFTDYTLKKIGANRKTLDSLKGSNRLIGDAGEAEKLGITQRMAADHIRVLENLLDEKYYYPAMATAHVIWLKENAPFIKGLYRFSGDIYYSGMLYSIARNEYELALETEPGNPYIAQRLADCLVAMGDFDTAERYYTKAVKLYRELGTEEGRDKIAEIEQVLQALPKKYSDIDLLLKEKRYEDAEAICKRRLSLNPNDYVALTQLGEIYWHRDKRKAALGLFKKVVKMAPDFPTAHLFLGKAYFFAQKYDEAAAEFKLFKKKMMLLPDMDGATADFYVSALHKISYYYSSQKRYAKMARECKEIIRLRPDDQVARYNLAVCYYKYYRKLPQAYNELKKVIEIDGEAHIAEEAKFFIDYMRRNPDPRFVTDISFMSEY